MDPVAVVAALRVLVRFFGQVAQEEDVREVQPPGEAPGLLTAAQLSARHPALLSLNRIAWAARHRHRNGLVAAGAVFESPFGRLLYHEPSMLQWVKGLAGRSKPRRQRIKDA